MAKKHKNEKKLPYVGNDSLEGFDVVSHDNSNQSVTFKVDFNFSSMTLEEYQQHLSYLFKLLEGYTFQKHDVFLKDDIQTYLTIIFKGKNGWFTYDKKTGNAFLETVEKLNNYLLKNGFNPKPVRWIEFNNLIRKFLGFNFVDSKFKIGFKRNDYRIIFPGENYMQSKSINQIQEESFDEFGFPYPFDILDFINSLPNHKGKVYHQVIDIPKQARELKKIKAKIRNLNTSSGNEAKIDSLINFKEVLKEDLLVIAHFNIFYTAKDIEELKTISQTIQNKLGAFNITTSENNFNQIELFLASLPGNATELDKDYDVFKTISKPLASFIFNNKHQFTNN